MSARIEHTVRRGVEGKQCKDCDEWLPLWDYGKRSAAWDGLEYRCRECFSLVNRRANLKKNYGLSVDEYAVMVERQAGVCACCGEPCSKWANLSVDHDHDTGAVRALLCHKCNTALGLLDEDPNKIEALAAYVRSHHPARN